MCVRVCVCVCASAPEEVVLSEKRFFKVLPLLLCKIGVDASGPPHILAQNRFGYAGAASRAQELVALCFELAPLAAHRPQHGKLQELRCQYLHVCTRNASKVSTFKSTGLMPPRPCHFDACSSGVSICTFVLVKQANGVRASCMYFCTRKASKRSTGVMHVLLY